MTACESAQQSSSCADRLRKAKWGLILRPSGRIAGEPLAGKFIEISAPHAPLIVPEPGKIVPAEDPRRMHVVEHQPNRIVADRLDLEDCDVALAGGRLALAKPHLGRPRRASFRYGRHFSPPVLPRCETPRTDLGPTWDRGRPAIPNLPPACGRI